MKLNDALRLPSETIESIIGKLGSTTKMPCKDYSIPASKCKVGSKLRKIKGSICSSCYCFRNNFTWPNVIKIQDKRFDSLKHKDWSTLVSALIIRENNSNYFRFHSSGDLQGVWHLKNIVQVAKNLPDIKFWLPTREYGFVREYKKKYGEFPKNLTVRLSAYMFDGVVPPAIASELNLPTSSASKENYTCPASEQGNKCLTCRFCWSQDVKNVIYKRH